MMVLTYMFALMGIHSSPAFSMWAFSNKDPEPFAPQQVWASSVGIGFALFIFTAAQGMGAHITRCRPSCECSRSKYFKCTSRINW